jgi:hypothetical protein
MEPRIRSSGIRVLTACSSFSTLSALAVRLSGMADPVRVTGFIAPAARFTATPGSSASLLLSVGRPISVLRDGKLVTRIGWLERRLLPMPAPIGRIHGHLFESADALMLPRIWPGLRTVESYVDSRIPGLNAFLSTAARLTFLRELAQRGRAIGLTLARRLGSATGALAFEMEGCDREISRHAFLAKRGSEVIPVAPAVLAARSLASNEFEPRGLVPSDRQVDRQAMQDFMRSAGIEFIRIG